MIHRSLIPLAVLLLVTSDAPAVVLAQWTFETSNPNNAGPHAAELGEFAAASFASTNSGGSVPVNSSGNGSVRGFSSNGWGDGEYFQFLTSTLGNSGIVLSFDQAASSTGPRDFRVLYSVDGADYVPFGAAYDGPDQDFVPNSVSLQNTRTFDFSSIPALDNKAAVGFRIAVSGTAAENLSTISTVGTFRVDNVTISTVPEPGTSFLGAATAMGLLLRRRRLVRRQE